MFEDKTTNVKNKYRMIYNFFSLILIIYATLKCYIAYRCPFIFIRTVEESDNDSVINNNIALYFYVIQIYQCISKDPMTEVAPYRIGFKYDTGIVSELLNSVIGMNVSSGTLSLL